jgi:hypothetical protein
MNIPQSPEDICTLAADFLKTETVNNITTARKDIEVLCARHYDQARRSTLEQNQFYFSLSRDQLALSGTVPLFGYPDQYQLPNDYLSMRFIADQDIPLTKYQYAIEKNFILIDNSGAESLDIGYISNVSDVLQFSASFIDLLAVEIAYRIAFATTGRPSDIQRLALMRKDFEARATTSNAMSQPLRSYVESPMAGARRLRAGPSWGYQSTSTKIL